MLGKRQEGARGAFEMCEGAKACEWRPGGSWRCEGKQGAQVEGAERGDWGGPGLGVSAVMWTEGWLCSFAARPSQTSLHS